MPQANVTGCRMKMKVTVRIGCLYVSWRRGKSWTLQRMRDQDSCQQDWNWFEEHESRKRERESEIQEMGRERERDAKFTGNQHNKTSNPSMASSVIMSDEVKEKCTLLQRTWREREGFFKPKLNLSWERHLGSFSLFFLFFLPLHLWHSSCCVNLNLTIIRPQSRVRKGESKKKKRVRTLTKIQTSSRRSRVASYRIQQMVTWAKRTQWVTQERHLLFRFFFFLSFSLQPTSLCQVSDRVPSCGLV